MNDAAFDVRFTEVKSLGDRLSEQLDRLREAAPVYWSENQQAWIITGHAVTTAAFRDSRAFSSAGREKRMLGFLPEDERTTRAPYLVAALRRMLFSQDAPEHPRIRRLMMGAFERPVIEPYRQQVRAIIDEALTRAAGFDEFDYVAEVAHRIPSRVILALLGLPPEVLPKLRGWAQRFTAGIGGGGVTPELIDAAEAACQEMRAALLPEIFKRRAAPSNDFISALVKSDDNGVRLSDEEILANCYLVLLAGHDTTSNTIALSTLCVARDPALWEFFATTSDPEASLNAVQELGRVIGMSYASARIMSKDLEFSGHHLREGDLIYLMQGIANRDPLVFPDPTWIDIERPQRANLSFGAGVHLCIGHLLAKMELTEFFMELTRRFAGVELIEERLDWATSIGFRGLNRLPVRLIRR